LVDIGWIVNRLCHGLEMVSHFVLVFSGIGLFVAKQIGGIADVADSSVFLIHSIKNINFY
jgi:cytochrome b subunit of formate dehydrogenase